MSEYLHYARCGHPVPPHRGPIRDNCNDCGGQPPPVADAHRGPSADHRHRLPPVVDPVDSLPPSFTSVLYRMADDGFTGLNAILAALYRNGWTLKDLGGAIGVSREAIRQRISRFESELPRRRARPEAQPKPPRWQEVDDDVADELRSLYEVAKSVNGGTLADDPRRSVAVQLAAKLAEQVEQGVSTASLARALGVTASALQFRLGRYGYRSLPPSQQGTEYKGRGAWDR